MSRSARIRRAYTSDEFLILGVLLGKRRAEDYGPTVRPLKRVRIEDAPSEASRAGPAASDDARRRSQRVTVEDVAEETNAAAEEGASGVCEEDDAQIPDPSRQRPSDGLRRKCPLCFGGARPKLQHSE